MERPPISCGTSPKARKFMFLFDNSSQVKSLLGAWSICVVHAITCLHRRFKIVESQKLHYVDCKVPKKFDNFMEKLGRISKTPHVFERSYHQHYPWYQALS